MSRYVMPGYVSFCSFNLSLSVHLHDGTTKFGKPMQRVNREFVFDWDVAIFQSAFLAKVVHDCIDTVFDLPHLITAREPSP